MIDSDVIYAKVANIQNCLRRIRQVTELQPERLDILDIQEIFILNLQRATQAAIDLSAHVVATENLGLPATLKDNFLLLQRSGIITQSLASRMASMVGLRNIAIHDYQNLNVNILKAILTKHLKDLEEFSGSILTHFQL